MSDSLLWYDYETFSLDTAQAAIAQFGALRTTPTLEITGEETLLYRKPFRDSWPSPDACRITGITPQHCDQHGLPDHQFADRLAALFAPPGTCGAGFNSLKFDDEVTRHLFYRNFIDPYAREYANGNSRFDLLPVLRLCHALRPEGITWPRDEHGRPVLKLEALTAANGIAHQGAHDAMVDVRATIALAQRLRDAQPALFDYAMTLRNKHRAREIADPGSGTPLVFSSGSLGAHRRFVTVIMPICHDDTNANRIIAVDLARSPQALLDTPIDTLRETLFARDDTRPGLLTFDLNKLPMIATLRTIRDWDAFEATSGLSRATCDRHLQEARDALALLKTRLPALYDTPPPARPDDPEYRLYDGFPTATDKALVQRVRRMAPDQLDASHLPFRDPRYALLLARYKARNHASALTAQEAGAWAAHCRQRLDHKWHPEQPDRHEFLARIDAMEQQYADDARTRSVCTALRQWETDLRP